MRFPYWHLLEPGWGRGALILGSAFGIVKTAPPDRTRQGDFRNLLGPEELIGLGAVAARIVIAGIISAGAMATGSTSQHAALGVYFGLEVLEIDFLFTFFCCHFVLFSFVTVMSLLPH